MSLDRIVYCPVVTTRDAEFRGFAQIFGRTLDSLLPVIEITRSRRSKTNPGGDIQKSLERALEVIGSRLFVLDVCGLGSQMNSQISDLLSSDNGFENWTTFLIDNVPSSCIPVVHLEEPFDLINFNTQLTRLQTKFSRIALRIPTSYEYLSQAIGALASGLKRGNVYVAFIDSGYVKEDTKYGAIKKISEMLSHLVNLRPLLCAPLSSSFPSSVVDVGYGADDQGQFPLTEIEVADAAKAVGETLNLRVVQGDYSTIHPNEFTGTVTNWVPRIDTPLDRSLFYHRIRRPAGGYALCAARTVKDPRYVRIKSWGIDQIEAAAAGSPAGKSPSFWISVRLNIHIERQVNRLK